MSLTSMTKYVILYVLFSIHMYQLPPFFSRLEENLLPPELIGIGIASLELASKEEENRSGERPRERWWRW